MPHSAAVAAPLFSVHDQPRTQRGRHQVFVASIITKSSCHSYTTIYSAIVCKYRAPVLAILLVQA